MFPLIVNVSGVRVRVTLRLAVSQSWCRAPLGLMTRLLVMYDYYGLCLLEAPSLTRGLDCQLSEVFVIFSCRVRICTSVYTL
jgi:hypothetical protein